MTFKRKAKSAWKGLTSPKAIAGYKKAGRGIRYAANKAAVYVEGTNTGVDRAMGIKASARDGLVGGYIPKGYKLKTVPKLIKGPRGYSVYEEKVLVKLGSKSSKKRSTKKVVRKSKRRSKKR